MMEDNNITAGVVSKDNDGRKILHSIGDGQNCEQNVIILDHSFVTSVKEDSCESTICRKTIDTDVRLNDCETGTFLQSTTQETDSEFVTVDEIEESLKQKEHISLSSSSSHSLGSISDSLKTGKFDSSLNALKEKKNQLINSLRSVLADSSSVDTSVIEVDDQANTSVDTVVSDFGNSEYRSNIGTSTPFPEYKPLAARFLRKWKPSFIDEEVGEIDEIDISDDPYEKAMAGLKQVLSDTSADTASKLDSYSNMLDVFKFENDKKYDEMISTIASENGNFEECLENATKEVDEFIEKFSEGNIGLERSSFVDESAIEIDSKESTLVEREKTIVISDTECTIKDVPKIPEVITIDSSLTENDETLVEAKKSETSPTPVESIEFDVPNNQKPTENDITVLESKNIETSQPPVESMQSEISNNQKPAENIPKENDLEILIIGGDEDIDINVDDEEFLLASDDEGGKLDKSEKKNHPQVPLLKDLEVFISNDPDENKDNNDPKWDYLRNLGTDYDRYLAVRTRWKNIQIPNPKKDLTCRCRNPVKQLFNYSTFNQNNNNATYQNYNRPSKKRPHSPENQYAFSKRARKESCTILFDRNIDQLAEDVKVERQRILNEQEQALQQLADIQHMEKYVTRQKGGTMVDMKRLENKHIIDTRKCVEDFRRRLEELIEMARAKLTALQKASEEVRQFHEFYPNEDEKHGDAKSLVYLSDEEVQEILEVEEMLLSFPALYNE